MPPSRDHIPRDQCYLADTYKEYIEANKEKLNKKCNQFTKCINQLLNKENTLAVLQGENISLRKTCGLMYTSTRKNTTEANDEICSREERADIQVVMENHLRDKFANPSEWKSVKRCLQNKYGDKERTTHVNDICKLAMRQAKLCRNYNTHKLVETFFNRQIQDLKCTCRSLQETDEASSSVVAIGAAVGGALFLLLILIFCFCWYRRQKAKKKKKKQSPSVVYLPAPNTDSHPIYQEVYDDRPYGGFIQAPPIPPNPPTLPVRYTSPPSAASSLTRAGEEPAYLEPIEAKASFRPKLPTPRQDSGNSGYEAPPQYSETDINTAPVASGEGNVDGAYFEPLPDPPDGVKKTQGYSKLGDATRTGETPEGYETIAAMLPAPSTSVKELEEKASKAKLEDASLPEESENVKDHLLPSSPDHGKPLGPVPAKRTKKDDRQTESHYFILEKQEDVQEEPNSGEDPEKVKIITDV